MTKNPFEFNVCGEIQKKVNNKVQEWEESIVDAGSFRPQTVKLLFDFRKLKWVYFVIFFVFLIILGRLFYLQIILGDTLRSAAEENRYRIYTTTAPRGVIYDRNNNLLVKNIPAFDVVVVPADLPKKEEELKRIWSNLELIIGLSSNEQENLFKEIDYKSSQPLLVKKNISQDQALILEAKLSEFPGIRIEKNPIREYLFAKDFSHILGYISKVSKEDLEKNQDYQLTDFIGKEGLEKTYENKLRGENGKEQVEVDSRGNIVKVVASQKPKVGQNLVLTIDRDLQIKAREFLEQGIKSAKAKKGVVIILNPTNGEILSLVSTPSFDNNIFSQGLNEDYNLLMSNPDQPLYNRAISGLYPPGSTIKPVVAAAGLQEGVITPKTAIMDAGSIDVPHKYNPNIVYHFVGWNKSGLGLVDLFSALALSSDIYFYYVGGGYKDFQGLGIEKLLKYYKEFGLGEKLGIDLPDEKSGIIPTPAWKKETKHEEWYLGDTYHISIGQGDLLVTPLQVAMWTAFFASDGKLFRPFIVKKIIDNNGDVVQENKAEVIREGFIKKEYIEFVKRGMRETVLSGSAKSLSSLPNVAGKTGTAQHGGSDKTHAWFTGFAPYDHPEVVILVLVEDGGEGSSVAVPIAGKILDWYFNNLKIKSES